MFKCSSCKEVSISRERYALGYTTCLECGEEFAQRLATTRKKQVATFDRDWETH